MLHFRRHERTRKKPEATRKEVSAYKNRMRTISTAVTFVIIFSFIFVVSYYAVGYFSSPNLATDETGGSLSDNLPKAALIDALYSNHPNVGFIRSVNETLQEVGFKVDIYQGTEVTVDFLKKLNSGYRLVILRMHSALSTNNELYLFTAEPYSAGKYTQEQYFRLVKEAYPTEDSESVFAVNWGFVKRLMTGKFNRTLVIAMGCDGACDPRMAEEIVNQGAIGYIGWNGPVLLSHSDRAILYLIQALYIEKLALAEAIEKSNNQIGEDPSWGTTLDYHIP